MSDIKTELPRTCCDICGAPFIIDGERWVPDTSFGVCYECQMVLSDVKLEHPDLWDAVEGSHACLNYERFAYLYNLKMLPQKGFPRGTKAYEMWRSAHPELGQRFDMSEFREVPGIEEKIEELWCVSDYDTEEDE